METNIIEPFVKSYLATAEWVECDSPSKGFTKIAKQNAIDDCSIFINMIFENFTKDEATKIISLEGNDVPRLAGHDFYLTRNNHGTGFWDRDEYNNIAKNASNKLTALAQVLGTSQAYKSRGGYLNFD